MGFYPETSTDEGTLITSHPTAVKLASTHLRAMLREAVHSMTPVRSPRHLPSHSNGQTDSEKVRTHPVGVPTAALGTVL